jgi:2-methylcitrate dehydratase PrpD
VDHPTGTPGNPMSDTMVQEKFHGLASAVLGAEKADKAQNALWNVDTMPDVSRLIPLLLK